MSMVNYIRFMFASSVCHRYKAKNICERKQRNQNTISAQENIIHKFENNKLYIIIQ